MIQVIAALILLVLASGARAAEPAETPAQAATRHYELAKAALAARDYATAAAEFDEALKHYDDANLVWNAARAHHKAGHLTLAKDRYERCLRSENLPAEQRDLIPDYLAEIERALSPTAATPKPSEPPRPTVRRDAPSKTGAWVLASAGLAVAATGLVLHFVAEGDRSDVLDARANETPFVRSVTQVEAKRIEEDANTLDTAGAVVLAVGGAALVGGVIWLLVPTSSDGEARVRGVIYPTGGGVAVHF